MHGWFRVATYFGALIAGCFAAGGNSIRTAAAEELRSSPNVKVAQESAFGSGNVWKLHLEISADEYQAIQPPGGGFGFGPGGPGGPNQPPAQNNGQNKKPARASERNLFGIEFPWGQADVTADDMKYKVGLRYAGDAGYFAAARGLKRPLRIQFDRFDKQSFQGLQEIDLHSSALDPSRIRETLAFAFFRRASVPAPRTAFAEVTLTVPGKFDHEYLGLYTLVERVDKAFVVDRFQSDKGLLMKPARMRGIDYLGDNWEQYKATYQPQTEPTSEQSQRVIEFARLINQANEQAFREGIDKYLVVDEFLSFMAANALLSNLESFFALGHNYFIYLHPETNKFLFIPGDLELSLANFLMMGSPDQLMDLSLTHPYPGESKLAERLLADKEIATRYQKRLRDLSATEFTRERWLKGIEAAVNVTRDIVAAESKAFAARNEPAGGFGPPGAPMPQAPDLPTFVEKRLASVEKQLAGSSTGHVPQFNFGPPPPTAGARAAEPPINDKTLHDFVKAPAGFEVTLFGAPPQVNYPVALSVSPTGEVFVAVDEQGSLGRTPGGGKVLRCVDTDGDGKADKVTVFAKMEHPRGVISQNGSVWVMHPPTLSVFHDDDGDGVSDRQDVLVTGLTTEQINTRGGDHTTDGIRMGIDGWIYIGDGDYGILEAKGKDGSAVTLRGGGILRVRPDGTELEIFATGLRNPFDIAIDPFLNLFTRDNTNDGAGWDVRVSHLIQTAHYGYTQLFANFPDEIMPTLGAFGGGGGTGALFIGSPDWPLEYRNILYTGDWGRSEVYRHPLKASGPTFATNQEVFLKIPRATGMDIDANGRLYVASWRGGEAAVYVGPNVGFVARVTPRDLAQKPFPNLKAADLKELVAHLAGPNPVMRLHSQREILSRGRSEAATQALAELASASDSALAARVAALFTLKQLDGAGCHETLLQLEQDNLIRKFALKALTDRRTELVGIDSAPFVRALADESPRVRAQAIISLVRLNDAATAQNILPLATRSVDSIMPNKAPVHAQPDPDRVIPHLAARALVSLNAIDVCLAAIDGPYREGALRALRSMHEKRAVDGLIKKLGTTFSTDLRQEILATLIRLYYREADYDGSWWGIRPDNTGPYFDRREWNQSERIGAVIRSAVLDGDAATGNFLRAELARHQVSLKGLPGTTASASQTQAEVQSAIVLQPSDPQNPNQIGNLSYEVATRRTLLSRGDREKGKALFASQSCRVCHTDADGQSPKGPHLVDIGKRYKADELVESILKPSAKIAQGFETWAFETTQGQVLSGFVVRERAGATLIRQLTGIETELKKDEIEGKARQEKSSMPEGAVNNLTPGQLADLIAYLQSLE